MYVIAFKHGAVVAYSGPFSDEKIAEYACKILRVSLPESDGFKVEFSLSPPRIVGAVDVDVGSVVGSLNKPEETTDKPVITVYYPVY